MRSRLAVVVTAGALLSACAHTAEKEPSMSPGQARAELTKTIQAVLEAAVPGCSPNVDSSGLDDGIPCGGLEGNEFDKIKHSINAATTHPVPNGASALTAMKAKLMELGYQATIEPIADHDVLFFSKPDGNGGNLQISPSGYVSADASTPCLDNPDQ